MANHGQENSGSSFWQLMLTIPGSIIAFTLLISLIAYMFSGSTETEEAPAAEVAASTENIEPLAQVEVASAEKDTAAEKTGEEITQQVCAMCHSSGLMESPKIGDAGQWEARIAQGYDTLVQNAINGIRNMPAKGGNPALSDKEVARAVVYMANQSGADFKEE